MQNDATIRRFRTPDTQPLIDLVSEVLPSASWWNEPAAAICRKLQQNDRMIFVAETDDGVIGCVLAGYDGVRGWIYNLAVRESHRRQGIGRQLLSHAEQALSSAGCPKVNLQVRTDNRSVAAFYNACGYSVEDRVSFGKLIHAPDQPPPCPSAPISVSNQIQLSSYQRNDKSRLIKLLSETPAYRDNGGSMPFPYTSVDADQWLGISYWEDPERNGIRTWAIRDSDDQLIGGVGLSDLKVDHSAEIGYWLQHSLWGQGITSSVVETVCRYAFQEFQLRRIYAHVFAGNPASAAILKKCGFTQEGLLRQHVFHNDQIHDVMVFGRLAEH